MALFLEHVPCPRCGSRDNLARYDDGSSWCFGCHLFQPPASSVVAGPPRREVGIALPSDSCSHYPEHVVKWILKYDIKVEEALKWGWLYSPYWDQLIFPFYGEGKELLAWQGRNFKEGARKYYTQGNISALLPISRISPSHDLSWKTLVVVEDVVSAAKIARQSDAMPCLGSYLPTQKIMRLKPFYETLVFWLDANKIKESRYMSDLAKWVGFKTKVVYTELDPKEHSDKDINEYLCCT